MIFDFVVLVLVSAALYRDRITGQSPVYRILCVDGIFCFVLAFSWYLAATVTAWLSFDIIVSPATMIVLNVLTLDGLKVTYMVSDTGATCVAIAACRSFVRLLTSRPIEYVCRLPSFSCAHSTLIG